MKKFTIMLLAGMLLTGCSSDKDADSSSTAEDTTKAAETVTYRTLDEFTASEFCTKMKSDGWSTYIPEFDSERYSLTRIIAGETHYEYIFSDKQSGQTVNYTVTYNTGSETLEDKMKEFTGEDNILTAGEMGGTSYDVYLVTYPDNIDADTGEILIDYNLSYMLAPKCEGYISVSGMSTEQDELQEYFSDIVLTVQQ